MKLSQILKLAFALALIGSLFLFVDLRALLATFAGLSFQWVIVLLLMSLSMVYVSALKWKVLLGDKSSAVSTMRLLKLYFIGYFVNSFLPSFVAGDALRSLYLGRSVGHKDAAVATVLERASGLLVMVLLSFCSVWLIPDIIPQLRNFVSLITLFCFLGTLCCFSPTLLKLLPSSKAADKLLSARVRALELLAKPSRLFEVITLSLIFHLLAIFNTWTCCAALGWSNVSVIQLCIIVPIVMLVSSLPVTPGGLGLQEGAFFYFLRKMGAASELALGVGLLLRAKTYVLAIIGGVFFVLEKKQLTQSKVN